MPIHFGEASSIFKQKYLHAIKRRAFNIELLYHFVLCVHFLPLYFRFLNIPIFFFWLGTSVPSVFSQFRRVGQMEDTEKDMSKPSFSELTSIGHLVELLSPITLIRSYRT